jgi:alpha-glucosidase
MSNWQERKVNVDFSFLPQGQFQAEIYSDAANANTDASAYSYKTVTVNRKTVLPMQMAKGGGFAMIVHP